jgi:hypothetical protein
MAQPNARSFNPEVAHEGKGWQRHAQRHDLEGTLAYLNEKLLPQVDAIGGNAEPCHNADFRKRSSARQE